MPEWLLKTENYCPESDKDTFTDKSILSFIALLSHIRAQSNIGKQNTSRINAELKVFFVLLTVVLLSISTKFAFVIVINVGILVALSLMDGEKIIKALRVSLVMSTFTFFIFIPSLLSGNFFTCIMVTTKVFATVTLVNILSQTTRWNAITKAFKTYFIPDIFIFVLDITMKYIYLLGELSLNMLYALKLRSVGRNRTKATSLSGIGGTMFIKSKEMAEEMHSAMECRGFTGEYRVKQKQSFGIFDLLFLLLNVLLIIIFTYFERK